jgi:outer membrane protein insertion porin family
LTELFLLKALYPLHLASGQHSGQRLGWLGWWLCALLLVLLPWLSGCSATRHLPEGHALYKDSRVEWERPPELRGRDVAELDKLQSDLLAFDKQQPNRLLLGLFPFKVWFYQQLSLREQGVLQQWVNNGRGITPLKNWLDKELYPEGKPELRDWFRERIGEAPVLYDSGSCQEAARTMEGYLFNNGFFQPRVQVRHAIKKKKGTAVYEVESGRRHTLHRIIPEVDDSLISQLIRQPADKAPLQPGQPYRLEDFRAERVRIRDTLLNNGYFNFDRNFVEFSLDSTAAPGQLDVYVRILPPPEDSMHRRYRIGNIYVFPDYRTASGASPSELDTFIRRNVRLVYQDLNFRPTTLTTPVYIRPGAWYNAADHALTLRKFNELGVFKFASITYRNAAPLPGEDSSEAPVPVLDALIRLQPAPRQQWSAEWNANTNFNSLIGSQIDFSYRNRNLFRNADLFSLRLTGGIETQIGQGENFIRNLDLTSVVNLDIPKFITPFTIRGSRKYNPVTSFAARYNYIQRIDFYTLHSTTFSLAYLWNRNERMAHRLSPVDLNLVRPTEITEQFRAILNENLLLTQSFQQQIIPGATYTFLFQEPAFNGGKSGLFYRAILESAGTLVNGLASIGGTGEEPNAIGGIPLAQFVRAQTDLRYYRDTQPGRTWAFRLAGGIGLPFGNSNTVPFVRQFFAGGPSSVRAWRIRRLGPGSFEAVDVEEQNVFVDQTGDINLEANIEYRFPIYNLVKGAFFVDAGNIWLLEQDETRPGGQFSRDFYRDIAIGTGFGLRLDFSFFIFRTDFGFRLRDPAIQGASPWLLSRPGEYLDNFNRNLEFNIAIGYPF